MKCTVILILFILLTAAFLNAENDEWGAWFKRSMEESKEYTIEPEDKGLNMYKWKHKKNELINNYKHSLEKDTSANVSTRAEIISSYYYDSSDKEISQVIDFFIFVIENETQKFIQFEALDHLTIMGLCGQEKAKSYIYSQKNNSSIPHRLNLQFHLANITIREDEQSLDYLMDLIIKAQDVETTEIKYSSPDEGAIAGYLNRGFFSRRYNKGLDYNYALPLLKQMIYSRSVSAQRTACFKYYYQTNRAEMRKIYDTCWAKVQNNSTPRAEFIEALYGLQALYSLSQRNIGKYKISFDGISSYFARLGGRKPVKNGFKYIELTDENRLTKEEKQYFQNRLRSK